MKRILITYLSKKLHFFAALLLAFVICTQTSAQSLDYGNFGGNNGNYEFNGGAYGWNKSTEPACKKAECNNTTCKMKVNNDGILTEKCPSGKRYDIDPNCVMNQTAKSNACIDTIPITSITRVAETLCYRPNGAGGNSTPRNHNGTDYATTEGTSVLAAADGTIVWAAPMTGAGRTIVMEHEKKCPCSEKGCDNKFVTVYMHLKAYVVKGGSVKKGTLIGYVGGSNYHGTLVDYPQPGSYGPHLHFEIHSGGWNKGYTTLKQSKINPLCDDIQSFCGGCSNTVEEECTGKTNTDQWATPDPDTGKTVIQPPPGLSTDVPSSGSVASGTPSQSNKSCDYQKFLLENDDCLFCPMFKVLFNTASSLALKTYNALKDAIATVVLVAFALWIAWYVLKQVSALEVKKPSKIIQELLVQAFKVLLVVLILKVSYGQILKLTLDPVFNTGMNYVQTVTGSGTCPSSAPYLEGLIGYETEMSPSAKGALPLSMGQNIVCSIKSMQDAVWRIVAFGRECRCVGWKIKAYIPFVLPNLAYVITGDLLIVAGLILILAFPWCLVDCILNMAIAAALLPAAIGAWAFKITSGYLKTLWDFFLNAMFNFVFLSIILYFIITVVNQFLQVVELYSTEYDKLIDPIKGIAFWSVNGLKLLMTCLLGWIFLKKGKDIAKEFAKAPSLNIGNKTGGFFAQAGKRLAMGSKGKDGKYHGGALGIAKGGAAMLGVAVVDPVGARIRKRVGNARNRRIMDNDRTTITTDENGNKVYELNKGIFGTRNLFGQKVTRRVTVGPDGNVIYSKEREKGITPLKNLVRDQANNIRSDLIQYADNKIKALFDGGLKDGQTAQSSDDGQTISIFNKHGKLIRTQKTLEDGTIEIRNSKGKLIASKKVDENGNTVLTTNHGQSVYDANGTLLSSEQTYRNPLLHQKTLSMQNTEAIHQAEVAATATSAAQNVEAAIAVAAPTDNIQNIEGIQQALSNLNAEELNAVYDKLATRLNAVQLENLKKQILFRFESDYLIQGSDGTILNEENIKTLNYEKAKAQLDLLDKIRDKSRTDALYEALQKRVRLLKSQKQSNSPFAVQRTTSSLRTEILDAVAKDGSGVQAFAQNYGIKRERDLSSPVGKTVSVTKDHLISVRQVKDARGNVIQEDYAFNAKIVKYLVRRDGSIDTALLRRLQTESKLSKEQINLAIAQTILKERRIRLDNKFFNRKVYFENGVLIVVQENLDGSVTKLSTQMFGNQMLVNMEMSGNGDFKHIVDNGVINRVVSKYKGEKASVHFGFDDHITQNSSVEHLINYANKYGQFAPSLNEEAALLGLSEKDKMLFAAQEMYGRDQVFDGQIQPIAVPETSSTQTQTPEQQRPPSEAKQKTEQEAQEKTEREAKERAEREAKEKAEKEAKERAEREAKEKAEKEAKEKAEREAKEKAEKEAKEKAEREAKERAEKEAKEKAEREAKEKAEREAKEKAEREAQIKRENRNKNFVDTWVDAEGTEHRIMKDGNGIVLLYDVKKKGEKEFTNLQTRKTYENGNIASDRIVTNDGLIQTTEYNTDGNKKSERTINTDGSYIYEVKYNDKGDKIFTLMSENGNLTFKEEYQDDGKTLKEYFKMDEPGTYTHQKYNDNGDLILDESAEDAQVTHRKSYYDDGKTLKESFEIKNSAWGSFDSDKTGYRREYESKKYDQDGNEIYSHITTYHVNGEEVQKTYELEKRENGDIISYKLDDNGETQETVEGNVRTVITTKENTTITQTETFETREEARNASEHVSARNASSPKRTQTETINLETGEITTKTDDRENNINTEIIRDPSTGTIKTTVRDQSKKDILVTTERTELSDHSYTQTTHIMDNTKTTNGITKDKEIIEVVDKDGYGTRTIKTTSGFLGKTKETITTEEIKPH